MTSLSLAHVILTKVQSAREWLVYVSPWLVCLQLSWPLEKVEGEAEVGARSLEGEQDGRP